MNSSSATYIQFHFRWKFCQRKWNEEFKWARSDVLSQTKKVSSWTLIPHESVDI